MLGISYRGSPRSARRSPTRTSSDRGSRYLWDHCHEAGAVEQTTDDSRARRAGRSLEVPKNQPAGLGSSVSLMGGGGGGVLRAGLA